MRKHSGFTLIELLVVILVIAILASISIIVFTSQQQAARNAERETKTMLIAESLEKYFDRHGEYPGCPAMTSNPDTVRNNTLVGISPNALVAPNAPDGTTNSIRCGDMTGSDDYFAYVGDGGGVCQSGAACTRWTLKYRDEGSGSAVSIESRRTASNFTPTVTLSGSALSATQIRLSWSANTVDTSSFQIQRSTNASFSGTTATNHTGSNATVSGLSPNTLYYFRIRITAPSASGWSAPVSIRTVP